ncbi:uncharacterized protein LOC124305549 [Neodiprion virginianus]|uniref:uncharacterized protein LOC124305549 n=1 Tax=Neodiprion virginianus TaxID=2961670 RepID=UPI001EE6A238|nr:uncharacterized protein LOC124305549 [Neodiprion virginianus]
MGNLPVAHIEPARPFARTGVDYAGPFSIKASAGQGIKTSKGYLTVFVCMCTKAVYLEFVGDLTSASFLGALHRFAARKTTPCEIWSDNATTFHCADAELRIMFREAGLEWDQVTRHLAASGISWNFIPPGAPHFGGLWEAAVKSAKSHLKKTIGQRTLTFEEMSTLIARVESCLNSRPLSPLSGEIDDLQALTPWHLVTGFAPTAMHEPEFEPRENLDRMTHWRLIKGMRNQFWMRWSRDYLHTLQQRTKWRQPQPNIEVGDLVVIMDTSLNRQGRWPLGRITAVHPGADGQVRVATIKMACGNFDRPIVKLCRLPPSM